MRTAGTSVRFGEHYFPGVATGLARVDAHGAFGAGSVQGDAADGGLRLFLDLLRALRIAAVRGVDEAVLDLLFQLVYDA